jgi:hypothetical protein
VVHVRRGVEHVVPLLQRLLQHTHTPTQELK